MLSIREGESGNHPHHKARKDSSSSKALLFEKVKEAEERLVRSGSDAVEESLVIISPHGLNPKVKRLVLKSYCLTVLGYKTGKFNRQWPLEDIVKVKRHAINHHCFTVTCLERKKKKIKNQRYSFEVKSEIECWRWIEVLTAATSAVLNEQNKTDAAAGKLGDSGGMLKRSRSTSAPPAMLPALLRGPSSSGKSSGLDTDDDDDDENDPYADEQTDDDEDDRPVSAHHAAYKEKEVEPQRRTISAFSSGSAAASAPAEQNWAHFQPNTASTLSPPGTPMRNVNHAASPLAGATVTFNPFAPASGQAQQQQPAQPISPYSAHQAQTQAQLQQQHSQQLLQQQHSQQQLLQQQQQQQHSQQQLLQQQHQQQHSQQNLQSMQSHVNHQQAFQQPHQQPQPQQQVHHNSHPHSPVQSLASPPSSMTPMTPMSPPSSGTSQQQHKPAESPKSASSVYVTTMSPPAHMRIVQDLGLLSATGSAAAPTNPAQCGAQVEAALQAARQELNLRAASRGANAVFQTSFSTAFHQWGVTVLACGTACVATMVTN